MLTRREIGTAACEAKRVRFFHFEHPVCLVNFTGIGGLVEVGYVAEAAHLKNGKFRQKVVVKNKRAKGS
jgi:hypothetical protein